MKRVSPTAEPKCRAAQADDSYRPIDPSTDAADVALLGDGPQATEIDVGRFSAQADGLGARSHQPQKRSGRPQPRTQRAQCARDRVRARSRGRIRQVDERFAERSLEPTQTRSLVREMLTA